MQFSTLKILNFDKFQTYDNLLKIRNIQLFSSYSTVACRVESEELEELKASLKGTCYSSATRKDECCHVIT